MTRSPRVDVLARRSFLSRVGGGVAAFAAAWSAGAEVADAAQPPTSSTSAAAAAAPDPHWQPARHAQDDWLDQIPGKHRLAWDTTTPDALEDAIQFAGNFYTTNKSVYGLDGNEIAVVIVLRHRSAPFAFNDAIWAKYGATLSKRAEFTDPKTKQAPSVNPFTPTMADATARARGIASLIKQGAQFAVCNLSTHGIASMIAAAAGISADAAYKELTANMIGNSRLVPAGIVAVNRVQERGYSIT